MNSPQKSSLTATTPGTSWYNRRQTSRPKSMPRAAKIAGDQHHGNVLRHGAIVGNQRVDRRGRGPIRRLDHEHVGADGGAVLGELDCLAGPPRTVRRHDQRPPVHVLDHHLGDLRDLVFREDRKEAVAPRQHHRFGLRLDDEVELPAEGVEIDLAWRVKGVRIEGQGPLRAARISGGQPRVPACAGLVPGGGIAWPTAGPSGDVCSAAIDVPAATAAPAANADVLRKPRRDSFDTAWKSLE